MSMKPNLRENGWIRWLGVASSIAILFMIVLIAKDENIAAEALVFIVALGFLPAFVSVFTSLAKCFWPNSLIGSWFLIVGIIAASEANGKAGTSPMLLLLAALTLSSTHILDMIFGKKMSMPYQPSESEHQGAPEAFKYELEMFCYSEEKLSNTQDKSLRKALLECTLLHARNLLDFFTGNQPMTGRIDEKSIRAGHFLKKDKWWKSDKLPNLQKRKNDINKALSHLTYVRIGAEYKWNDLPKIREEIEEAYSEFLKLLPEEDRAKWPALKNS